MRIENNVHAWSRITAADGSFTKSNGDAPFSIGTKYYHFQDANSAHPSQGVIALGSRSGGGDYCIVIQ